MKDDKYDIVNKREEGYKEEYRDDYRFDEEVSSPIKLRPNGRGMKAIYVAISFILGAFICGSVVFNFLIKDLIIYEPSGEIVDSVGDENSQNTMKDTEGKTQSDRSNYIEAENSVIYYAIQCGVFKEKEYADELHNELKSHGIPFIYEEEGVYRVFFGIYEDEASLSVSAYLKENGFESARVILGMANDEETENLLNELVMAVLRVNWKIENDSMEEFASESIKEWLNGIDIDAFEGELKEEAVVIANEISGFDEYITREKAEEMYMKIFHILKSEQ